MESFDCQLFHSRRQLLLRDFFQAFLINGIHSVCGERFVKSARYFCDLRQNFLVEFARYDFSVFVAELREPSRCVAHGNCFAFDSADAERINYNVFFCCLFCAFYGGGFELFAVAYQYDYLFVGRFGESDFGLGYRGGDICSAALNDVRVQRFERKPERVVVERKGALQKRLPAECDYADSVAVEHV